MKELKDMNYDELLAYISNKHIKELRSLSITCGHFDDMHQFMRDMTILMMKHLELNNTERPDNSKRLGINTRNTMSGY